MIKKESFVKVFNFIQREFAYSTQIENQGRYIPFFDKHDNFPVELDLLVQGSPTATSCLSTLTDFIAGEGFNIGPELENLIINRQGLKFFQFNTICAGSLAKKWGVASLVRYNKVGGITEVMDIPFNYCRLKAPDDNGLISKILYNPYFGTSLYKPQDNEEYDVFNPNAAVVQANDKKWKGQIFWAAIRDGKHPFYPVPDYYSAKEWMNVEKNAGIYFDENLEHGFLNDYIFKLIGDPNESSGQETSDGKPITKGEAFNSEMTKNFTGSRNRAKAMAWWGSNKEEWPDVQAFPTSGNPDLYRVQDEHATKKITIATKVPAILANISEGVSLGGDGNTIRASVKLMQQRVLRMQGFLIDYYTSILSNFVFPDGVVKPTNIRITPYHPFPELETVDPQAWAVLSREEQRKWVKDHTEIEIQDEVQPVQEPPQVQNQYLNLHFNSYPKSARDTAKRAIEFHDKMGIKCLNKIGFELNRQIIDGTPLGPKEIRRLSNYLSTNILYNNRTYSDSCEKIKFDAWGGVDMMKWANEKVKELKGDEAD